MSSRARRSAGFTLLEVLVAITVLMIGITGVTALFTHGLMIARGGDEAAGAAHIGRSVRDALAVAMSAPRLLGTVYWVNFVHDGVGVGTSQMATAPGNVGLPQYPLPLPRVFGEVRHHPGNQSLNATTLAPAAPQDAGLPVYGPAGNLWVSPRSTRHPLGDEIFRIGATPAPAGAEIGVWQNPLFETIKDIRGAPVEKSADLTANPMPTDMTLDYGQYWYDILVEGEFAGPAGPALARMYRFTVRVYRGEYTAGQWSNPALGAPVAVLQFPLAAMD
ncbi:MAG: prepilin-type N-terminal cleavage/methylation domain-containing protein [Planctomycetes bacterium]|nr:prepilin-type N-terminal cleavage/methylation domain-containing protein [Planctomycetota bacterium]